MEVSGEEYNELCQKAYELRRGFYRTYGIKPNAVYVGNDEFYNLKTGNEFLLEHTPKKNSADWTLFGMELKRVTEDNYLSVGIIIK